MTNYTMGRDINGNKIVKVKVGKARAFSIQTNGNLPDIDKNGPMPENIGSITEYIRKFGTKQQKELLGV